MAERAHLVVLDAALETPPQIELPQVECQGVVAPAVVAGHALGTRSEPPGLLANLRRKGDIGHGDRLCVAAALHQVSVSLLIVPCIGVGAPLLSVEVQNLRLDVPARASGGIVDLWIAPAGWASSVSSESVRTRTLSLGQAGLSSPHTPLPQVTFCVPGTAIQRCAVAPSTHCAALTLNGSTPGAGVWSFVDANNPVSLSLRGNCRGLLMSGLRAIFQSPRRRDPR